MKLNTRQIYLNVSHHVKMYITGTWTFYRKMPVTKWHWNGDLKFEGKLTRRREMESFQVRENNLQRPCHWEKGLWELYTDMGNQAAVSVLLSLTRACKTPRVSSYMQILVWWVWSGAWDPTVYWDLPSGVSVPGPQTTLWVIKCWVELVSAAMTIKGDRIV